MKKFRIKEEFLDEWGYGVSSDELDRIVTEEEVQSIARGWETPVEELMDQLEELPDGEE